MNNSLFAILLLSMPAPVPAPPLTHPAPWLRRDTTVHLDTLPTIPIRPAMGDTTPFRRSSISHPPKRVLLSLHNIAQLTTVEHVINALPDSIRTKTPILVLMISGGGAIHTFHNYATLAATQPSVAQAITHTGLTPETFWPLLYSAELAVTQEPIFENTKPNSMAHGDMLRNAEFVYTYKKDVTSVQLDWSEDWGDGLKNTVLKDTVFTEPFDPTPCLHPVIVDACKQIAVSW
jgi:hypothetical protein